MAGSAFEFALPASVSLINQQPARTKRLHKFGKDFPFQIKEDENQVVSPATGAELLHISPHKFNAIIKPPRVFPRLGQSNFRYIDQAHPPVPSSQPDCVPPQAARHIERGPRTRKQWPNIVLVSPQQKRIRLSRPVRTFPIPPIPAFPFLFHQNNLLPHPAEHNGP